MTDKEVMQMALYALESWQKEDVYGWGETDNAAVEALRTALAQPEQAPVAWCGKTENFGHGFNLICGKPSPTGIHQCDSCKVKIAKQQYKPLTGTEIVLLWETTEGSMGHPERFARAIEAAHGIGAA